MKHNANVPAFLSKLWTLVEDADTNEFICWSQEGTSFMVLNEQRFSKEILPKFFKHNNMASFIRQLNMYGFRKVMHVDSGIVKQERDGPVEFQHPYFKHGQDELLENIKRKVSNARPEDNKIRQTDLTNILATVQSVHCKQEDIDVRLSTLKRENEALWTEISDLRKKHSHQQQLIKKLIHFLLTLVQNNGLLNLKRKRPLLMNPTGKKSKFIHEVYDDGVSVEQNNSLNSNSDVSDDVIICDFTDVVDDDFLLDASQGSSKGHEHNDVEIVEVDDVKLEVSTTYAEPSAQNQPSPDRGALTSSALLLNTQSALSQEDPVKLMDYILKENGAMSQNISLLGKMELLDYLGSIDCSLEDFQAMLGKPFGLDTEETVGLKHGSGLLDQSKTEPNTDNQLIQYTSSPFLAFLDGCSTPSELDLSTATTSTPGSGQQEATLTAAEKVDSLSSELLEEGLDRAQAKRSSLIRLEPLTEAEASEETLFYLCNLSPGPESDSAQAEVL